MSSTAVHLLDLVGFRRRRSSRSNGGDGIIVEHGSRRVSIQGSLDPATDLAVLRADPSHLLLESITKAVEVGGRGMANVEAEPHVRRADVGAPCVRAVSLLLLADSAAIGSSPGSRVRMPCERREVESALAQWLSDASLMTYSRSESSKRLCELVTGDDALSSAEHGIRSSRERSASRMTVAPLHTATVVSERRTHEGQIIKTHVNIHGVPTISLSSLDNAHQLVRSLENRPLLCGTSSQLHPGSAELERSLTNVKLEVSGERHRLVRAGRVAEEADASELRFHGS